MLFFIAILLIFIAFILLLYLTWSSPPNPHYDYPTIHTRCRDDKSCDGTTCVTHCGGDLTCDKISHRCKKQLGGNCSSHVDCETGLLCHNWKCVSNYDEISNPTSSDSSSNSSDKKRVHWNNHDEIFPIPPNKR